MFSMNLNPEPADIPPMELTVDTEQWEQPMNSRPPRVQTVAKQNETRKQVQDMLDNNVIEPSSAMAHSQVLFTPKPDGDLRFCVDFRNLNVATKMVGWPIPNINLMLQRIGHTHPKVFGVMDLTQGYFQAPLHENSRVFTAFITILGLFQWLRVAMGLKGAPAYFQRVMSTIVLVGLIHIICESYIDDIIVHATSDDQFIDRLDHVLARLLKHKIIVKPTKCRFGMLSCEYVGKVIDSEGITFSKEKKQVVLDFRKPKTRGDLKSFIGMAEYFHDHIRNFSIIMRPLHQLILGYSKANKHKVLVWNEEAENAFITIQQAIANSTTLYFMDEKATVYLQTDASDYGIGAYLFQFIKGKEKPVAFISKTLDKTQLRWSTPEKEAYAIFYSFKKLEHLIRDIPFILQTDHKNLTYINETGSAKVFRWKLAIQEYNFEIEYIPGPTNVVADHLSRWCKFRQHNTLGGVEKNIAHTDGTEYLLTTTESFQILTEAYNFISSVHNSSVGHLE